MTAAAALAPASSFLHPGIATAALAAALIPILIHLINRRRFQKLPWAAMAFLLAANRRSARRLRLERFLLLAVRMATVLMIGLAISRPYTASAPALGLGNSHVHRVLVLDNSLSMQAVRQDGRTRFDAAHELAQRLLAAFPPGDGISIITSAQPVEVLIASPTYDRRMAKETLAGIVPTQNVDDIVGALEALKKVLGESDSPPNNRVVYLISDFPQKEWQGEAGVQPAAARGLAEIADILGHPESNLNLNCVDSGTTENLAVTELRAESTLLSVQMPASFVASVANFGTSMVRGAALQIRLGTQTVRRENLAPIAPGETASVVFSAELSSVGSKLLEARVTSSGSDSLPLDDARWLSMVARDSIPLLIVDGRPGTRLIDGQAGYLAVALAPRDDASPQQAVSWGRAAANLYDVKIISEPELGSELSRAYDLVALCNVPRLTPDHWVGLEQFVSGGGGLFVSLGGLVNVDNYNRHGFADGKGIMPARLDRIQEFPLEGNRLGFQLGTTSVPLFDDFAAQHKSGLFSARVDRYFALDSVSVEAQLPLLYTNQAPAMVLATRGAGRIALWTTTTNMEWNNLPARGDFVAVMAKSFAGLPRPQGRHRNLLVGQTLVEPLTPAEISRPLKIDWGEGRSAAASLVPTENGLAAQYGPLESAGSATLSIGDEPRDFAINIDPTESSLQPAEQSAIATAIGRPLRWMTEQEFLAPVSSASTEWSGAFMWFALGFLLLELWMAQRFSAPRLDRHSRGDRPRRAAMREFAGAARR